MTLRNSSTESKNVANRARGIGFTDIGSGLVKTSELERNYCKERIVIMSEATLKAEEEDTLAEMPQPSPTANRRGSADLLQDINLEHHGPEWQPKPSDKRVERLKKKRKAFGSKTSSLYAESFASFDVADSGRSRSIRNYWKI